MINDIKTVVILGAGGTMGSLTGGIIAQNGIKVYFLSRTESHAELGMERAIAQARSDIIKINIVCGAYESLLEKALKEADWVVECVSENIEVKRNLFELIDRYKKQDAVVSSSTSSLSISNLCKGRSTDFKKNFLGIHFYNPPGKLNACEMVPQSDTVPNVVHFMKNFLERRLGRVVVIVRDVAGFVGNRIAFLLFSEITALAEKHGIATMDYLIGPYTGRMLSPLSTLDLIGLDIYKAIVNILHEDTNDQMHNFFKIPEYLQTMINKGHLGIKTPDRGGFYKKDDRGNRFVIDLNTIEYITIQTPKMEFVEKAKSMIHIGKYRDAFEIIKTSDCKEADIIRRILCLYIAYSYSCIKEITDVKYGIHEIDKVMAFGYNWAPPSVILSMMGGIKDVVKFLQKYGIEIPHTLKNTNKSLDPHLNPGRFFIAC